MSEQKETRIVTNEDLQDAKKGLLLFLKLKKQGEFKFLPSFHTKLLSREDEQEFFRLMSRNIDKALEFLQTPETFKGVAGRHRWQFLKSLNQLSKMKKDENANKIIKNVEKTFLDLLKKTKLPAEGMDAIRDRAGRGNIRKMKNMMKLTMLLGMVKPENIVEVVNNVIANTEKTVSSIFNYIASGGSGDPPAPRLPVEDPNPRFPGGDDDDVGRDIEDGGGDDDPDDPNGGGGDDDPDDPDDPNGGGIDWVKAMKRFLKIFMDALTTYGDVKTTKAFREIMNLKKLDSENFEKIKKLFTELKEDPSYDKNKMEKLLTDTFEMHPPPFSFMGAGTNIFNRLMQETKTGEPSIPINKLDTIAMLHDMYYMSKDPLARQKADDILMEQTENMTGDVVDVARFFIGTKIILEQKLGIPLNLFGDLSGDEKYRGTFTKEEEQKTNDVYNKYMKLYEDMGITFPDDNSCVIGNIAKKDLNILKKNFKEIQKDIMDVEEARVDIEFPAIENILNDTNINKTMSDLETILAGLNKSKTRKVIIQNIRDNVWKSDDYPELFTLFKNAMTQGTSHAQVDDFIFLTTGGSATGRTTIDKINNAKNNLNENEEKETGRDDAEDTEEADGPDVGAGETEEAGGPNVGGDGDVGNGVKGLENSINRLIEIMTVDVSDDTGSETVGGAADDLTKSFDALGYGVTNPDSKKAVGDVSASADEVKKSDVNFALGDTVPISLWRPFTSTQNQDMEIKKKMKWNGYLYPGTGYRRPRVQYKKQPPAILRNENFNRNFYINKFQAAIPAQMTPLNNYQLPPQYWDNRRYNPELSPWMNPQNARLQRGRF